MTHLRRVVLLGEFAERVWLTPANVAVLNNGRAKAVHFSTLEAMCRVRECQPGDPLEWVDDHDAAPQPTYSPSAGQAVVDVDPLGLDTGSEHAITR